MLNIGHHLSLLLFPAAVALLLEGDSYLFELTNMFYRYAGAAAAVHLPTKVECLDGITIKMAALGSEHSVAITGMELVIF